MDFPSTFQMVKNLPAIQETQGLNLGNLTDGGAWWATRLPSMGSQNSWT